MRPAGPARANRASGVLRCCLLLDYFFFVGRLGSATWSLGQRSFNLLDGFRLGAALRGSNLTREPVKRSLIELTLRVRRLNPRNAIVDGGIARARGTFSRPEHDLADALAPHLGANGGICDRRVYHAPVTIASYKHCV